MNDYLKELFIDEVKNLGKGGSGGVSSWNELSDRPFYAIYDFVEIQNIPVLKGSSSSPYVETSAWRDVTVRLKPNTTYVASFCGQEFTATAEEVVHDTLGTIVRIGFASQNESTFGVGYVDSVYPFTIFTRMSNNRTYVIWDPKLNIEGVYRQTAFILKEVIEQVVPLDPKFLPDTVATKAYVEELIGGIENGTY